MPAKRREHSDDFTSDDIPSSRKGNDPDTAPTRCDGVEAGFAETGPKGERLFHSIVTDEFSVGRAEENNLVVRGDAKVSRRHAIVRRSGIALWIEDCGSVNGVVVNGRKITGPCELKVGDKIQIGLHHYVFARRTIG